MLKKMTAFAAATVLALSLATTTNAAQFKDVPATHSLNIEIEYLAGKGIISGYSDGTFKPNAPIAKKHVAKMLVSALDLPTTNLKPLPYKDVPTTHPYYKEIAAAYTAGIFGNATHFKPESSISRAFMAKMLATSFNLKSIADNAVTYKDVPATDEFYRPIQLVTMNNIARGYEHANGWQPTYTFEPNKLLTRAHFSAFLARAMSLRAGDYTPDTRYNYFYENSVDERRTVLKFDKDYSMGNYLKTSWNLYDAITNKHYENSIYSIADGSWSEGIPESSSGTFVDYPFTIGLKYDYLDDEFLRERQEVIDTDATYKIGGKDYEHVVIVRQMYKDYTQDTPTLTTRHIYIAKHYGIIAYESDGYYYHWLSERERR